MNRNYNSSLNGYSFSDSTKRLVWNKATIIPGVKPDYRRLDKCGAVIQWDKHGDTTANGLGWEIDHIKPVSKGGTDDISNLQPLQWQNNRAKADNYPANGYCVVSAK